MMIKIIRNGEKEEAAYGRWNKSVGNFAELWIVVSLRRVLSEEDFTAVLESLRQLLNL